MTPDEAKRELEQALEQDRAAATEVAGRVWRAWLVAGDVSDGRRLLASVLDDGEATPSRDRALALYGDGLLAFRQGAQEESRARNEAALGVARAVHDREAEALALVGLSRVAFRDGDYEQVRSLAAAARELTRDLEPKAGVAPLHMLAAGTRLAGDHDEAVRLYEESLELNRRLGDRRVVAMEHHNLGHVELRRGNVEQAERHFAEASELRNPDDPYDVAMGRLNEAGLASVRGDAAHVRELLAQVESRVAAAGIVLDPDDASEVEWLLGRSGTS